MFSTDVLYEVDEQGRKTFYLHRQEPNGAYNLLNLIRKNAEVGTKPLSDREKVAKLEAEPKVKVYRSMQLIDGKPYPPMSAKVDSKLAIINIRNISQNTKVTRKSSTFAA